MEKVIKNKYTCFVCLKPIGRESYVSTSNPKAASLLQGILSVNTSLFTQPRKLCQACKRTMTSFSEASEKLQNFITSFHAKYQQLTSYGTIDQEESSPNDAKRPKIMQVTDNLGVRNADPNNAPVEKRAKVKVSLI